MKQLLCLIALAPVVALVALTAGCAKNIPTADVLGVVGKAALCVEAVNATATDPVCRVALGPCRAAFDAGKDVVDSAKK